MIDAFDVQLDVDAEYNGAATGIRQRHDPLRDALRIREVYFELEVGVFAAPDQAHDLGARRQRRGGLIEIFLERAVSDRFVALSTAESFASHLCMAGPATRPDASLRLWIQS